MSTVPTHVGVFFGQVDKRSKGWYWADAKREKLRGIFRGPFETKKSALEDALALLRDVPNETEERGVA